MREIQQQQEELLDEFHAVCEYVSELMHSNTWVETYPDFPIHFPIPEHHATAYPNVVCFWRAVQKHVSLARLWTKWCSHRCILSWSQVQPVSLQLFLSDVQMLCMQTLASTTTSITPSDTTWETLMSVFGCGDTVSGSVWSSSYCRDQVLHPAELPFQPKPCPHADVRYTCSALFPIFQYVSSTRTCLSVDHLSHIFTSTLGARTYIALLPLHHKYSETVSQWQQTGNAVVLASQVSFKKVVSRMPRYFTGDGVCQWWLILPHRHHNFRLNSHMYHQGFGRLVQKHVDGGYLLQTPPRLMPLREFNLPQQPPRTFAQCTIRNLDTEKKE